MVLGLECVEIAQLIRQNGVLQYRLACLALPLGRTPRSLPRPARSSPAADDRVPPSAASLGPSISEYIESGLLAMVNMPPRSYVHMFKCSNGYPVTSKPYACGILAKDDHVNRVEGASP